MWQDGAWREVEDTTDRAPAGDPSITHDVAVPASAADGGVVFARVQIRLDAGLPSGNGFELGPATGGTT